MTHVRTQCDHEEHLLDLFELIKGYKENRAAVQLP